MPWNVYKNVKEWITFKHCLIRSPLAYVLKKNFIGTLKSQISIMSGIVTECFFFFLHAVRIYIREKFRKWSPHSQFAFIVNWPQLEIVLSYVINSNSSKIAGLHCELNTINFTLWTIYLQNWYFQMRKRLDLPHCLNDKRMGYCLFNGMVIALLST